ncbi:PHP domain-containing protein [Candidatus Woesearchaeota archaeon]|nr:PHP domain-containing protein [Candidatus Woesearchaeota archaeon]
MDYSENIKFSKPNLPKLISNGYKCIDMHYHTMYSDGSTKLSTLKKRLDQLKIGVAITDHNEVKGALVLQHENIIAGIEVKDKNGIDVLFYFYNASELKEFFIKELIKHKKGNRFMSRILKDHREIIESSKRYNCISSFAHPGKYKNPAESELTDCIEVINSGSTRQRNLSAIKYAEKNQKSFTAGSDSHSTFEIGKSITYSKADNLDEFLDNIKKKKNYCTGTELKYGFKQRLFFNGIERIQNLIK